MKKFKAIIIDENEIFRKSLRIVLKARYDIEIIAETSNIEAANNQINWHLTDFLIIGLNIPDESGIEFIKELLLFDNRLKVIALVRNKENIDISSMIEAGIMGCLYKQSLFYEIDEAMESVINGNLFFSNELLLTN